MKKITLLFMLIVGAKFSKAQNGLECVIVEKYYITDANDATANATDGVLPVGSTTYRIYADMLPGYKFQAAFGVPTHELRLQTTTLFFNNEDRGATTPTYSKTHAKSNTVMVDSWLSVGASCVGNFGVLEAEDDGVANVVNSDGLLINNDAACGLPLTTQDGHRVGTPEPVTAVGITTEIAMFDNQNDGTNGPLFSTWNGSWASLNGSVGIDPVINKVLIAQITTNGVFSFELNIQIGTPSGGTQQYVAKNPVGAETMLPCLTYNSITDVNGNDPAKSIPVIAIYPNPAKDAFTLDISNSKSLNNNYTIYDAKGSLIAQKQFGDASSKYNERIDISAYPKGMYFVIVSLDGAITSKKIIKN